MTCNGTNIATDSKTCQKFANLVSEASGGNVTIDVFANDQLAGGKYYASRLSDKGLTHLVSVHNGFRQIKNGKRPVRTPDDVAGLKVRVPGGEVYFKFRHAFGADPVAISWSETFTAIQQDTIDRQENAFSVTNSVKVNEIQQSYGLWTKCDKIYFG